HGLPHGIVDRRPLVAWADGIAPLVGGNEVTARESVYARADLAQLPDHLCTETFDVVGRYEREHANPHLAAAGGNDLDARVVGADRRREHQRMARVLHAERRQSDGLARLRALAPDQAHVHARPRLTRGDNVTLVALALAHREPALPHADRCLAIRMQQRGMLSD